MKLGYLKKGVIFFVVLFMADFLLANLANRKVIQENYYFENHLKSVTLGAEHGQQITCRFDTVLGFYVYKVCFMRLSSKGDEDWVYNFYYNRPFPILLGGRNESGYRFSLFDSLTPRKKIYSNYNVEEAK